MKRWVHASEDTSQQIDVSSIHVGQEVKDMSEIDPETRIVKSVRNIGKGKYDVSFEDGSGGTYEVGDKFAIVSKTINASSTRDRIGYLEERIHDLKEKIANSDYEDPDDMIDDQLELQELEEQLNFAWQDDEAEYNYALQQQEFNPDGSLKGYDDYYDETCCKTKVTCGTEIVPNKRIQEGLWWDSDGHNMEVTWVSKDGKKCKITETWISEDDGKHKKHVMNCLIGSDENGEYAYEPTDYNIEHLNDDSYWWIKKYATGAWNYPYDLTNTDDESEDTLGRILNRYIQEANDGDYYNTVKVITEDDEILYKGHVLEEAQRALEDYADCKAESSWHDDAITIIVSCNVSDEDNYTPSATAGDYSPSNPWDAPGMSVKDFI